MTSANDTACIVHLIACRLMNVEWKMLINNNNNISRVFIEFTDSDFAASFSIRTRKYFDRQLYKNRK